jgi:hypothetical protein
MSKKTCQQKISPKFHCWPPTWYHRDGILVPLTILGQLGKNFSPINLITHTTYGAEILGGVDLSLEQVTPKRSSHQTKHLMRNRSFLAKGQEQEVESKNFKSERIGFMRLVGARSLGERSHKTFAWSPHIKPDEQNILQKTPKIHKRKTRRIKGFDTRLRASNHYELLRHIQLQDTSRDHKSWMARGANKVPTYEQKRWLPNEPLLLAYQLSWTHRSVSFIQKNMPV